jgi:hypothetical protein
MLLKTDLNVDQEAVESIISQSNRIQEIIDDTALSILKDRVSLWNKKKSNLIFIIFLEDVQVNHISRAKAKGTRLGFIVRQRFLKF